MAVPLSFHENVSLAPLTTFGVGGPARYLAEISRESELPEALSFADGVGLPIFVLGGGSNLLVPDEGYPGLVLRLQMGGIEREGDKFIAGAGVEWDMFVDRVVAEDCAGVECLAGIPGSVGGTPVQNVGAYGQEVAETIVGVRAYDRAGRGFWNMTAEECHFRYRASIFNTDERNRYIVTQVTYALRPHGAPSLRYADLQRRFADSPQPGLAEVAAAVREIRRSKGMLLVAGDPDTRSAGSFFKNPIVPEAMLQAVASAAGLAAEKVPHWPAGADRIKLPAAWLLEHAGFVKGYGEGRVGISSRHTLALINRGDATFADVQHFEGEIVAKVQEIFGIRLEREPVLLA